MTALSLPLDEGPAPQGAGPPVLHARVLGPPQFYGNPKIILNRKTNRPLMTERGDRKVKNWQQALREACLECAPEQPINAPVRVVIQVLFHRPAAHYGSGRNADRLKESAPLHMIGRPDGDKIARCVLDCLTGTWIIDDARVAELHVTKFYTSGGEAEQTKVWLQRLGV